MGFPPTAEQSRAIAVFADFYTDSQLSIVNYQLSIRPKAVMVLRGCAGTGKTTLAAAIVRALKALQQKMVLLAPTGRAAKVFSLYAGHPAFTIHRRIYRQRTGADPDASAFSLGFNAAQDTLFIVDEASMISDASANSFSMAAANSSLFTLHSSLLSDLLQFVYNGRNCRLLLIGDQAQLPPVGESESPALSAACLRGYDLDVYEATLNEVLRQAAESGILYNATLIRHGSPDTMAAANSTLYTLHSSRAKLDSSLFTLHSSLPQIRTSGFEDVHVVPGDELIEALATSYSRVGLDDTIVVTRSNKRANIYNEGIRRTILDREDELCRGDRLMIVKNNYYWVSFEEGGRRKEEGDYHQPHFFPHDTLPHDYPRSSSLVPPSSIIDFLANGDVAVVQRVRNVHEQHGFRFAEVTMTLSDYDDYELTATVLLDTLTSEAPALTHEQQQQLFERVMADYADVHGKAERLKRLKEDRYYNALQVKFAYAVTCHKAQGGQWAHVYVDQGYMTDDMLTADYYHWLYTAFTRATEQLFLVNWPKVQLTE